MASHMDSHFGPQLAGHFDFTLLFEQTIFEIAPNSLLVLATPYFLKTFASRPTTPMRGPLFCAKMFFGALLVAFYITKAVLSQRASEYYSEASVACSVMSIIASICAFVILYIAHACRRTPSTFISLFFSLTILLDITLARSYYLRHRMGLVSMNPIAVTQTVIVLLKLWLVVLEEVPKRRFESKRTASSRLKCDSELGFWGKVMFFSVNSLLLFGYKTEITVEDLHQIDEKLDSRVLFDAFFAHWSNTAFNLSLTPVIVIAGARFWTRSTPTMTAAEIFSTYAIILITSEPLDSLLERAIMWASSYACITRVQNYLSLPEMEDARLVEETKEKGSDLDDKIHRPLPGGSDTVAIRMEAVNVGSDNGRSILNNVSLSIPAGSLVMVRGTVGSGKSIFLQAILGEIKPIKGSISVLSKDISFAAQNPWIRNQTVRENITGPNTVAESVYEEIIYCCALDADIAEFPCGSETMTGTDGCNLSGGQKQRLGLARSLCTTASIVILDDVLSALDSPTAATVFDRLLGPGGLLRRRGTTVIMTTNTVELFSAADLILEIMADGTINQQQGEKLHPPLVMEAAPTAAALDKDASSSVPRDTNIKSTASSAATDVGQTRQKRDLGLYAYLFRSAGPLLLSLWIVSIAFASVAEKMPKIFVQIWYTIAPENNTYFAGFVLSACANILITAAATLFYFILIVPELSNELHWRLLSTTVGSTLAWIAQTDTGTSLNRFSQDISVISQQLPISFLQFTFILFNTLVDIGIFAAGAKYTAPIMLMLLFALYGVQYFYLRTSRQLRILDLETSAPLLTLFNETSTGIQHVRAFQWQGQFMDECCRLVDRMQKPYYGLLSVQQWLAFVLDMSTCFIATILIAVSTALPSSTSEASIGLALVNLVSFSVMTSALIRVWVTFETCLGGLARIRTFCATTPQETDAPADTGVPEQWPMSGRIDIESVSASYTYEDGTVHQALSNVSIVIKHGEKVCISGRTGSGKSSLFLALLRMIEFSGTIRIDGRDISTIPREVLRSRITTLTQDGVEVDQSVRFNMYPFDENKPTDDAILEMLNLVGLGPHVLSQGGIDAKMSSMKFSSGQKQLFFIARGVLHHKNARTNIVMMDEATSSIDSIFDEQIQKLMHEQLKDCTLILISHRLHSLGTVDMVVKLDAGSIADVKKCTPASA
ncbi:ABC multidrug transporter [Cordyceps javanica]|uniref:ABC multidrug transporter n=1 Tax=Cordyceps javanica TaxID=43265 RepID=A0A545V8Z4_9HYPO|nr:ABC multidrug transporter [Cordyceps javanica]